MSTLDFIQTLQSFKKPFFTMADLEKITGLSRPSLCVAVLRLMEKGALVRLKRGVYASGSLPADIGKAANQLYYPSYLSFESTLSRYGILSQVPLVQTFATTKQSKKMKLGSERVEFRRLKTELFFGYELNDGVYIAAPEKALLDALYMKARGRGIILLQELNLRVIDRKQFRKYAKKFPSYMESFIQEAEQYIGSAAVTLETQERM